jgi:hypothetical protein
MELQGVMDFVKDFESSLQATSLSTASLADGSSLKAIQSLIDSLSEGNCLFCDQADEKDKLVAMPAAELLKPEVFELAENVSPLDKINDMLKGLGFNAKV